MNRWIQAKPRQIRTNRRRPQVESLEQRALLAADPIIAEFLSSNQSILEDGDRESSDWIEVYNQGDESADLEGWYLTDDQRDLTKWVFPSTSVGTNEYLVVFASGKNQLDSKGNLHTNFKLSVDAEYLALVQPDGQTIASEFSPEYPRQFTDVSYGILMDDAQTDLVSGTSLAQLHVPSDNSLGETWTLPDFAVDDSWITTGDDGMPARAAVGFETDSGFAADIQTDVQSLLKGVHPGLYMRIPFVVDDPNAIRELTLELKYDDGYLVYLNGNLMDLQNAPFFKSYDSTALDERPNEEAVVFESTDLEEFLGALQPGENVLAIHAMNVAADDDDFLIVPRLHTAILAVQPDQVGYFSSPTPGKQNANEFSVGPRIDDASHWPAQPSANDPLVVTAEVNRTLEDVGSVALTYRVMYGDEVQVAMADDGAGLDITANDGVFTGVIPAGVAAPGQMLRYFVTATDTSDNAMRSPRPIDGSGTDRSPEYFGTVVADPDLTSDLPIFHWFSENERRGRTRSGTRASVFYQDEFYDNIFVRQRGGATNASSQKFNFNDDQPFYVNEELGRVAEFNMNANGSDPGYLRQSLAFNSYTWAGNESSESFLMLMRVNAGRDRVGIFIEQVDQDFLERHGLDPNGALYKFVQRGNLDPVFSDVSTGIEKKIPQDNNLADLREVVDGLTQTTAEARANSVFDHFNLAQLMNFLAVRSVTMDADDVRKNFYGYRDTNGTGQWSIFPWDKDWTFGILGDGGPELPHPFFGDQAHRKPNANQWNRLYEAVFNDPVLSEMYLRRLRTVMDQLLQPDSTPAEDRLYEQRVDALFATAADDLPASAERQVDALKRFFDTRRDTLYNDHTVTDAGPIVDIISEFDTVRYFVPTDDSLGDSWQGIAEPANIADWATGQTGIGYESSDNFVDLIRTPLKPADTCAECNSIYLRMPFNVDDPAAIPALTLRMKYDDGFVAYINGTEVARANYDGAPSYDGTASRTHPNRSATEFENFLIQNHQQLLQTGQNVLAVYSVNRSASNSDQLILPALVSGAINDPNAAGIPPAQIGNPEVRIGEFLHDPASGNQDEEYIRLDNPNNTAVDISDWTLTGGIEHKFLPGTVIPANGSLYVSPSVPDFMARTTGPRGGQGLVVQGNYRGHLSNFGETVELAAADGTPMAALTTPVDPSDQQLYLRISEVHYNPPGPGDETEFIELVNVSQGNDAVSLDLSGVTIAEGPSEPFVFGDGARLEPGERTLVVKNDAAFRAAYPDVEAALIQGEFLGSLSNGGERIKVNDQGGRTIVDFTYSDSALWPQRADGSGASLELIDSTRGQERKSYSWRGSVDVGGSPGRAGQPAAGVVINEVRSSSNGREDAIELYNTTSSPIDIGGWFLSDSDEDLLKYELPAGTVIQAGQYHVVEEEQFNPLPAGTKSFALNGSEGDDVWLVTVDQGQVTSFVDDIHFGASPTAMTMGRVPNGVGRLVPLAAPTLGSLNAEPTVGSVVITEVNYHPLEPSDAALQTFSQLDRDDLEFLEITNTASSPMNLTGWRIRGGVDFDFDEGTTIEAGQSIVITPFNSTRADNAQRTEAFRLQHQIAQDVKLVGGYSGRLSDNQDRIQLQMPLPAVDEIIPRVAVDEVIYDDQSPWPIQADGAGASLHRSTASAFGHDANSWISRTPSPGQYDAVSGDLNGDGEVNAADIDRLCQAINQADSAFDLNNSGRTDLADLSFFVQDVLGTNVGDANVDRVFDSSDLVAVFQAGEYEDDIAGNSTWSEGDWNCDGEFNTSDLVAAFQSGAYVGGARRA